MSKKITVLLFSLGLIAGCARQGGTAETITLWHYFSSVDGPVFNKYIEEFNKIQKEVIVKPEFIPREELLKQYSLGVVGGDLPDIGMLDNPDHAAFSAAGLFEDITDKFNLWGADKFLEGPLNSVKYKGRVYGVPQASVPLALYYNKKALAEAGVDVPKTWQDLKTVLPKLTKPGRYGLAISMVKNEEGTFQLIPWLLSSGAETSKVDSPEAISTLTFLNDLFQAGYISKEALVWGQGDVEKQFISGRAAMMVNGPWILPSIRASLLEDDWGVTLIPFEKRHATALGGENFVIIKGKNVDASWKFFQWFLSKEVSERYSKEINKFSPRSDIDPLSLWPDDPKMQVFAEAMKYTFPRGPHPKWPEISTALISAVHETVSGQKAPQKALQDAQAVIGSLN